MQQREHQLLNRRALTLFPLVLTLFCLVSGGPYGLEQAVKLAGPGMAILLILLLPFIWAAPVALMTAELTSAIPEEGGYYAWSKRALGKFWGFQCGWWTWLYAMTDAAIYPVLFTEYLGTLLHLWTGANPLAESVSLKIAVNVGLIAVFTYLNIRGTRLVGRTSVVLGLMLILPFLGMVMIGGARWMFDPSRLTGPFVAPETSWAAAFSSGLYIVMWNYLGWDTLSTISEEVEDPRRTFPRALILCLPLVTAIYVLPVLVGLRFAPDYRVWEDGSWPLIAQSVGGSGLAQVVSIAGLVSPIALFVTAVLGASRIPFVLAEDKFMPRPLLTVHPRFGTPWVSILFCAVIYVLLTTLFSFVELVELNVTLYSASLVPELIALVMLRLRESGLARPFRIRGGWLGVAAVAILPITVAAVAFGASLMDPEEGWFDQIPVLALLASGPIYYGISKWRSKPEGPG